MDSFDLSIMQQIFQGVGKSIANKKGLEFDDNPDNFDLNIFEGMSDDEFKSELTDFVNNSENSKLEELTGDTDEFVNQFVDEFYNEVDTDHDKKLSKEELDAMEAKANANEEGNTPPSGTTSSEMQALMNYTTQLMMALLAGDDESNPYLQETKGSDGKIKYVVSDNNKGGSTGGTGQVGTSDDEGGYSPGAVQLEKRKDGQSWDDYWKAAGYNEKTGSAFAKKAAKTGGNRGTTGKCATGVSQSYKAYFGVEMHGNGRDWDENMRTQKNFKEISTEGMSKKELEQTLKHLPAGAVVCWESQDRNGNGKLSKSGSSAGEYYGHVTVADGKGGEYSDHHAKNIYSDRIYEHGFSNDKCAIFIPV